MAIRPSTLTLVGDNALILDRDNITFTEDILRWQKDPANKDLSHAGDDRSPAWGWLGKLHYEDTTPERRVGVPMAMLGACVRDAAAMVPHPTAGGKKTLKDISQSGILFNRPLYPLEVHRPGSADWDFVSYTDLYDKLRSEEDFVTQQAVAASLGVTLDVRRAKPQWNRSHVRVRPLFGPWQLQCDVTITDEILTPDLVERIFTLAGRYKGLGNWRPSVPKAGAYGTFSVRLTTP
jgi:hypothetical protein